MSDELVRSEVAEGLMRADGVVGVLPSPDVAGFRATKLATDGRQFSVQLPQPLNMGNPG